MVCKRTQDTQETQRQQQLNRSAGAWRPVDDADTSTIPSAGALSHQGLLDRKFQLHRDCKASCEPRQQVLLDLMYPGLATCSAGPVCFVDSLETLDFGGFLNCWMTADFKFKIFVTSYAVKARQLSPATLNKLCSKTAGTSLRSSSPLILRECRSSGVCGAVPASAFRSLLPAWPPLPDSTQADKQL